MAGQSPVSRVAAALAALALIVPAGSIAGSGAPGATTPAGGLDANRRTAVFVELREGAAVDAVASASVGDPSAGRAAAKAARTNIDRMAASVLTSARGRGSNAREIFRTRNAIAGMAVIADAATVARLATHADVRAVHPLVPKHLHNANAVVATNALAVWQNLGRFGDGVRIGIIDSGVDYTHASFGGPGTPAAFAAVDPVAATALFPSAKVVGGVDLAGEDYDADSPISAVPQPDGNPLDCDGHGSHVAGSAAGFGVNGNGSTFTGDYAALDASTLLGMRVGPGAAPRALLYAIKVFGCPNGHSGSTALLASALDWALDPNGDGDFSDHLDVVNASLGEDFAAPDDPDNLFVRKVSEHGVLVVTSAGNGGDVYDLGGAPGNAPEVLAVASSVDAMELLDGFEVTSPAAVAGMKRGQYSTNFDYAGFDMTAETVNLTQTDNSDGCLPYNATDAARVNGKIVWLEWDDDDATRRCGSTARANRALIAGATGVLLASQLERFPVPIGGNSAIPVVQLTLSSNAQLRPFMLFNHLFVRIAGGLQRSLPSLFPSIDDTVSFFSSRGTRMPTVKPDLAAPGATIASTAMGTGNASRIDSGTSMAAPHAAGIAALLRQAHPDWTPAEIKAGIMNTAGHDLYSAENGVGPILAPNRVGAGRIDAEAALRNTVLASSFDDVEGVSLTFGVLEVAKTRAKEKKIIKLVNKGDVNVTYDVAYAAATTIPGVSVHLDRPSVLVPAGKTAKVKVTLEILRDELRKTVDPTVATSSSGSARQFLADASGRVVFTPTAGSNVALRVPLYSAPKPVANIKVAGSVKVNAGTGAGLLGVSGTGLDQGSADQAYRSLLSVLQLVAESPRLLPCAPGVLTGCAINGTASSGDLRYVGVASNARRMAAAGRPGDAMLVFGIATWSDWSNLGGHTLPYVEIDTDGDTLANYKVTVSRAGDLLVAETVDLAIGVAIDAVPVNLLDGDTDSNVFDTNVALLPVRLSTIGIDATGASAPITYSIGVDGLHHAPADAHVDSIPGRLSFDPLRPGIDVASPDGSLVFAAVPRTSLSVIRDAGALAAGAPNRALVLNLHNASGRRATVVTMK